VGKENDFILWKYPKKMPLEIPKTIGSVISRPALLSRDVILPDSQ
jgi:hypothetical protein